MSLSEDSIALDIKVTNGVIDGTIGTPQICASIPFFDFLLVRGKVNVARSSARVIVWDIFEGHKRDVAALDLKREGAVMIVAPKEGAVRLFPAGARIALDPSVRPPSTPFCEGKQEALTKALEQMLNDRQSQQRPAPDGAGR